MAQLSDLEYLKLSKGRRLGYKLGRFFAKIPKSTLQVFQRIWEFLKLCVTTVGLRLPGQGTDPAGTAVPAV